MPVFDEELHGDLCFGSFCPHYTVLNKLPAASALTLYTRRFMCVVFVYKRDAIYILVAADR